MRFSEAIKPISYLKAHAAEIIHRFEKNPTPIIITQNGEAKAVLQDIRSYEELQKSLILLKLILIGRADMESRRTRPMTKAFSDIRKRIKEKQIETSQD
jgi:prevent-host-death family protein